VIDFQLTEEHLALHQGKQRHRLKILGNPTLHFSLVSGIFVTFSDFEKAVKL